jgi:hypothetical protein
MSGKIQKKPGFLWWGSGKILLSCSKIPGFWPLREDLKETGFLMVGKRENSAFLQQDSRFLAPQERFKRNRVSYGGEAGKFGFPAARFPVSGPSGKI